MFPESGFIHGHVGEMVSRGWEWDAEFPAIFSLFDKNWHRMRWVGVFRELPRSSLA
jgi:hypothetical protein